MRKFWNWVRNSDEQKRTLYLNGPIAEETWWGDEVTPRVFKMNCLLAHEQHLADHHLRQLWRDF